MNLTKFQVLLGTAIGDGCIFKDKRARNYRMNLAHSLKQKEYFMSKYNELKDIIECGYKESGVYDKRTKKTYHEIRFQSKTKPIFTELHDMCYKNGKKFISRDVASEMSDCALAIKYFDDGYFVRDAACIAMNNFDEQSVRNVIEMLKQKYDISATYQRSGQIYIPKAEFPKFKEIVRPYATSDVLYKLGELLES